MTDRVILTNLRFEATHGVHAHEKTRPQRFEVDVELEIDLGSAGSSDDLTRTADYGTVATLVSAVVDGPPVNLIETLAERVAAETLRAFAAVEAVTVRVRKPEVKLVAPLDHASVEIRRERETLPRRPGR
ncbi:MAG: dihydroneopterin aldolase [Chloroflexi bacterium]|nr:dihydroneopterin aldolase [Chloroflexota bacterium]